MKVKRNDIEKGNGGNETKEKKINRRKAKERKKDHFQNGFFLD